MKLNSTLRSGGLLVLLGVLFLAAGLPAEPDWTLKRTGDEMWVYTRDKVGSEIKEVRLVMEVEASIDDINQVLNDASLQTEWVYRCEKAKDLGGDIDTGWYYYSRISMPWPMDDRDLVAKVVGSQKEEHYQSRSTAAPDYRPHLDDCIRITNFNVRTMYRELDARRTEMTYEIHSEPGGAVPSWLVNMFVDKGPVETMTKLRRLVEER